MLYDISYWFIIFLTYSVFGWLMEIITCSIKEKKLVKDRGFLLGPYCPIWGWGAVLVIFFLKDYQNDFKALFLFAMVGSAVLEYLTSYLMEKIFKARWWDYSDEKFNIEGRICLVNCIGFGILGLIIINIINPLYDSVLVLIPSNIFIGITFILFLGFLVDNITSFTIISKIKSNLTLTKKDSTYDIDRQVKAILAKNFFFTKHILRSFPAVDFKIPSANNIISILKNKLEDIEGTIKKHK